MPRRPVSSSLTGEIEDFLNYCLDTDKSLVTVRSYEQVLLAFATWLQAAHPDVLGIASVSLSHLQAFRRHLRLRSAAEGREMAASTQAKYLSILRSWLRYARHEVGLPVIDRDDVVLPKRPANRRASPLSSAEVDRLLSEPDQSRVWGLRDRAIIAVLVATGLRVGELCALDRRDLREDLLATTPSLPLRQRSRGLAEVTLDTRAQEYLKAYLAARDDSYKPLFIRHRPGKRLDNDDADHRLTRQMVNRMLENYSRKAGLPELVSPSMLGKAGR